MQYSHKRTKVYSIGYLIVGIDSGTTTAVALIDLNGDIKDITSRRDFSFSSIIRYILSEGKPLLISTDVIRVPKKIKKIKKAFECKLYTPKENLKHKEKRKVISAHFRAKKIKSSLKNDHEKDALSSALFALKSLAPVLTKIKKSLKSAEKEKIDEVAFLLLSEKAENISRAKRFIDSAKGTDTKNTVSS